MTNAPIQSNQIPVKDGLFTLAQDSKSGPRLMASRCPACSEIFFPRRRICQNCQSPGLKEIKLGPHGKIFSYTVVMQQPAGNYRGPVPYAFGWVELPEGVRIETLYTGCELDELRVGMDVELVVETLHRDREGREIICHKFRPVTDTGSSEY